MRLGIISLLLMVTTSLSAQHQKETLVLIKTPYGEITAKLYNDTPQHRDNFLKLIQQGWYDQSPFHRVINNFMIQGGSNKEGKNGPGYTVAAEFKSHYIHKKGALAAARLSDQVNPEKRSSGSQFYIVQGKKYQANDLRMMSQRTGFNYTEEQIRTYAAQGGTPHLDGHYTVFGEVIDGFEVIDKIAAVKTGEADRPLTDVRMTIEIID